MIAPHRPSGFGGVKRPGTQQRALRKGTRLLARTHIEQTPLTQAPPTEHPLADLAISSALQERSDAIDAAFEAIEPAVRAAAAQQFDAGFPERAGAELEAALGIDVPADHLAATWAAPLDVRGLYAHCVLETYRRLANRAFDRNLSALSEGEDAATLIRRWGFHAIDITPCADGRLSGVLDDILRVPPAVVVSRTSHAGAMFDVEATVRRWERLSYR